MLTLFLLTVLIYHRCFRRYDADPEPELGLPAKRLTFLSGPNRLQGYLCGTGDTLAVLAPGLGNGAFSYAPQIQWLAKAGLRVFSFDYTGCYGSTGRSCRGFPQAADDLRAALRFLEENGRFGSRRLVLLGHSMGGYAVCCALPGSRVDAAFYLQINEFRGNRTVQLQMVDIRPSLTVSTREDECLHLLERCLRGDRLLPKEAIHLLPSRSQCVQLWRALEHTVPPEGLTACYLPLLRELSARLEGADPFLRTAFCLEVFRERQLLTLRQEGDTISITLTGQGKHVRLEESGYLQGLHEVMQPKRGGDHHD